MEYTHYREFIWSPPSSLVLMYFVVINAIDDQIDHAQRLNHLRIICHPQRPLHIFHKRIWNSNRITIMTVAVANCLLPTATVNFLRNHATDRTLNSKLKVKAS